MLDASLPGLRPRTGCVAALVAVSMFAQQVFANACQPLKASDWLSPAPALTMPVAPAHCMTVDQTPPQFSWPDQGETRYELELRDSTGRVSRHAAERNWLLPEAPLPAGRYHWRVKPVNAPGKGYGEWRQFSIAADAVPFAVPASRQLLATAKAKARPRAFPSGAERENYVQALLTQRGASWTAFLDNARAQLRLPHVTAPESLAVDQGDRKDYSRQLGDNKKQANGEINRMLDAALAWMVTRDPAFLADARQALMLMSQWDPRGATGVNHHQVAGLMAWALALGLDWLHAELSPDERRQIVTVLAVRMDDLIGEFDIYPRRKLDKAPFNSHGWVAIGELAATASLMVGEDARFDVWFEATVRPFVFLYSPWGGMDGGMGNGTAYGVWDAVALTLPLDILRLTVGVDMYRKGWSRKVGRFLTYFLPPGARTGVFGDGAESGLLVGDAGNLANAWASRMPDPVIGWYARQVPGRRPNDFLRMFPTPEPPRQAAGIPEIPAAAHFPTIGWSAMHSTLADRGKVSVYFRSSSYGSFNHSHADQNSFVLHAYGQPLLIDSGVYDSYGSPHGAGWYRQTRAHNAITFDGGQGQVLQKAGDAAAAPGRIVDFHHSEKMDWVTGDSAKAYGGAVTQALRTLVYLRPNLLVVYDALASTTARSWEWNLHGLAAFRPEGPGRVNLHVGAEKLCIEMHSTADFDFGQTDRYTVSPDFRSAAEAVDQKQWHGRFASRQPTAEAAFVAVLNVGCSGDAPVVTRQGDRRYLLTHGGVSLSLTPRGLVRDSR